MKCNKRRDSLDKDILAFKALASFANQAAEDPSLFKYVLKDFDFEVDMFDIMQYILSTRDSIPCMNEMSLSFTKDEICELSKILADLQERQRDFMNSRGINVLAPYSLEEYLQSIKPYVMHNVVYVRFLIFSCMTILNTLDHSQMLRSLPSASDFVTAILLEWTYEVLIAKYNFKNPFESHAQRFILNCNMNATRVFYSNEIMDAFIDLNIMSKIALSDYNLASESPVEFIRRLRDEVGIVKHTGVPLGIQSNCFESDAMMAIKSTGGVSSSQTSCSFNVSKSTYSVYSNPYDDVSYGVFSGYKNVNVLDRFIKLYGIDRSKLNAIDIKSKARERLKFPKDPDGLDDLTTKVVLGIHMGGSGSLPYGLLESRFVDQNSNKFEGLDLTTNSFSDLVDYSIDCYSSQMYDVERFIKENRPDYQKLDHSTIVSVLRGNSEVYREFLGTKKPVRRFDEFALSYYENCKRALADSKLSIFEDDVEDIKTRIHNRADMKAVANIIDKQVVDDVTKCDDQFNATSELWWDYIDKGYLCDPEIDVANEETLSRYSIAQEMAYEYPGVGNLYRNWVVRRSGKFSLGLANKFIRVYKETGKLNSAIESTVFDFVVQAPVWMRRYYIENSRLERIVGHHNIDEFMTGLNPDYYTLYMLLAYYMDADYYRDEDYILNSTGQVYRASASVYSYILNHSEEYDDLKKLYTSSYDMQCFTLTGSLSALESSMLNIRNAQITEDRITHFADLYAVRAKHSMKNIESCMRPMSGVYKRFEEVTRHPHTSVPVLENSFENDLKEIALKIPEITSDSVMNRTLSCDEINSLVDKAISGSDKDRENAYDVFRKEFDALFENHLRNLVTNHDKVNFSLLPDNSDICIASADMESFLSVWGHFALDFETVRDSIPKWQAQCAADRSSGEVLLAPKTYTAKDIRSMWNQYSGSRIFTKYDKAYLVLLYTLMQKLKNPSMSVTHLMSYVNKPLVRFAWYLSGLAYDVDLKNLLCMEYSDFAQSERLNPKFISRINMLHSWCSEYNTEYMSSLQTWIQSEQFKTLDDLSHKLDVSNAEVDRLNSKSKELSSAIRDLKKEYQRKQSSDKSSDKSKNKKSKGKKDDAEVELLRLRQELESRDKEIQSLTERCNTLSESKQEVQRNFNKSQKQVEELLQDVNKLGEALAQSREEADRLVSMQQDSVSLQTPSSISLTAYINALKDKNIVVIGGDPTHKKLKNLGMPKLRLYSADKKAYTADQIKSADLVIIATGFISHTAQDNVMGIAKANDVPLIRMESFSANRIIYEAFNALYDKVD